MYGNNSQKSHYQLYERKWSFQSKTVWLYFWQIYFLQLITILDTRTYEIDRGYHTYVIYMDFKKAFDTVPHKRLISKIISLNISKEIVNWIEAFISNRRQKVAVNGKESNWHDVTSGIPQGTVLGPLLFVLYINDLPDLTQSDTFLFADDIKIFRSIINTNDQDILQQDITTIEKWSHDWMLTLHPDKCIQLWKLEKIM